MSIHICSKLKNLTNTGLQGAINFMSYVLIFVANKDLQASLIDVCAKSFLDVLL